MRTLLPISLAVLTGCLPALDFDVVGEGEDAGPPVGRVDAGRGDGGGRVDAGPAVADHCRPEPTCGDGCPMPWLLASVQDLSARRECGGQVLRVSVATERPCVCRSLVAGGALPDVPMTVAFAPPNVVVVAAEDDVAVGVDADTDRVLFRYGIAQQPRDSFFLHDASGAARIAVGVSRRGDTQVRQVYFIDPATGAGSSEMASALGLGLSDASITHSTADRSWLRALAPNGGYAAADVDPWTGTRMSDPPYVRTTSGSFLRTIYSFWSGGRHRTAWTGTRSDMPGRPSEVYQIADPVQRPDSAMPDGDVCTEGDDGLAYDVTCDFAHAVPDPTTAGKVFALCVVGEDRRLVHMRSAGESCATVVEHADLFDGARIWRLGVALDAYAPP